ncbi:MAG: hypothetical protein ACO3ZY_13905, partial [Phycisphaerales bacterium]
MVIDSFLTGTIVIGAEDVGRGSFVCGSRLDPRRDGGSATVRGDVENPAMSTDPSAQPALFEHAVALHEAGR